MAFLTGKPITGYVVEYQDTSASSWTRVEVPSSPTSRTVGGLETGKFYKFRVRAKNEVGEGSPREAPSAITPPSESSIRFSFHHNLLI